MSTDKEATEIKKIASQLIDVAVTAKTHRLALQALLATYTVFAEKHPCCTAVAAAMALTVSLRLAELDAGRPPGAAVH